MRYILTIAGSDSCGGAGIQADIRTITSLKAHALTVLTAVTAQNSRGIFDIHKVPARFISSQIQSILEDIRPNAVKIGMLMTKTAVKEVVESITRYRLLPVVVDPVLKASTGRALLDPSALLFLKTRLFPLADIITPNLNEAEILTGRRVRSVKEMEDVAKELKKIGPNVVVTGGHLHENCVDLLYDGKNFYPFSSPRIETEDTHGSGCVFSTSLTTFLAMDYDTIEATRLAHEFTRKAIINSYPCGQGAGVVSPSW
jgi:hydroxymethylpyrimidine/phosphomethylpyrimidine kinase